MNTSNPQSQDLKRLQAVSAWLVRAYRATGRKGFSIGFDLRRGWLASYSETTGYIIPTCYRFAKLFHQPDFADMATSAARWLVSIQAPEGYFSEWSGRHNRPCLRAPIVFNTGQCLFGLLAAYKVTGESIFLEAAYRAGHWIAQLQSADGVWLNPGFGAAESASYYTRVTWPIQLLADEIGDADLAICARRGLDAILARVLVNKSVDFWGFRPSEPAFTHTIAYTVEGLLEHGLLSSDRTSVQAARAIAQVMLELLAQHDRLAGSYDENWRGDYSFVCLPGNSQLALIFMRLYLLDGEERYLLGARQVLQPVLNSQWNSPMVPGFARGSVPGSWPPIFGKYMRWLYPNWVAKYLADALMFKLYLEGVINGKDEDEFPRMLGLLPG